MLPSTMFTVPLRHTTKPPTRYRVSLERAARGRGLMPPLQAHPERTTYSVIEGTMTFFLGETAVRAEAGCTVIVQADAAHTFRIEGDGARWRVATEVSSVARFDDLGRALAQPGSMTPQDVATVSAIAATNGIRILGSPGTLPQRTPNSREA
jgi:mannose-6-phosphate isomerase-like protein (cupin superfamily)